MDSLLPIVQTMVDVDFFSPTKSRMAKELGRKDKNIFYGRLSAVAKDGKPVLGPAALDALCRDICFSYNISEYTLEHLLDFWNWSHALAEQCGENDFLPLVGKRFSVVKDEQLRSNLRTLAAASALDYCYVLAIFYCLTQHLDPNAKKDTHVLIEITQKVDAILRKKIPENVVAHQVACDTIDQARSIKLYGWCHLMNFVGRMICSYYNPSYLDELVAEYYKPLPIGEESWWVPVNDMNADRATLYFLALVSEDCALYDVLRVEADIHADLNSAYCAYFRMGFLTQYEVMRFVQPQNNKLLDWGYYDYLYEEENSMQIIGTKPHKELNGKHIPLALPDALFRVQKGSKWDNWIASQKEDAAWAIMTRLELDAMGMEDTDFEVVDVILSRRTCRLQYRLPKQTPEMVEFSLEQYPLLKKISVWDDVYILRSPVDQSLCAFWSDKGLLVKIK